MSADERVNYYRSGQCRNNPDALVDNWNREIAGKSSYPIASTHRRTVSESI